MHSLKWFQILLSNINSFICMQLNGFKHCYVTLTIQFRYTVKESQVLLINPNNSIQHYSFINPLKLFQVLLCITNNSIKHQSFVYIWLNGQPVLFLSIRFNISHLFAYNLNVKQFYLTHRWDPIRCYHSGSEWTWEQ